MSNANHTTYTSIHIHTSKIPLLTNPPVIYLSIYSNWDHRLDLIGNVLRHMTLLMYILFHMHTQIQEKEVTQTS